MQAQTIFDFKPGADISRWNIVDDVVMGGRSNGKFELNADGNGVFSGVISLENNGGFSSVQYKFNRMNTSKHKRLCIRLKGDGKTYQLRLKSRSGIYYSYVADFKTSGEWETIEVLFSDMYPSWRGRRLNFSNFNGEMMEEIGFLIGNKKAENFIMEIDKIEVQ